MTTGKLKVLSGTESIILLTNSRTVLIQTNLKIIIFILNSKTMNQKETGTSGEVQTPFFCHCQRAPTLISGL